MKKPKRKKSRASRRAPSEQAKDLAKQSRIQSAPPQWYCNALICAGIVALTGQLMALLILLFPGSPWFPFVRYFFLTLFTGRLSSYCGFIFRGLGKVLSAAMETPAHRRDFDDGRAFAALENLRIAVGSGLIRLRNSDLPNGSDSTASGQMDRQGQKCAHASRIRSVLALAGRAFVRVSSDVLDRGLRRWRDQTDEPQETLRNCATLLRDLENSFAGADKARGIW